MDLCLPEGSTRQMFPSACALVFVYACRFSSLVDHGIEGGAIHYGGGRARVVISQTFFWGCEANEGGAAYISDSCAIFTMGSCFFDCCADNLYQAVFSSVFDDTDQNRITGSSTISTLAQSGASVVIGLELGRISYFQNNQSFCCAHNTALKCGRWTSISMEFNIIASNRMGDLLQFGSDDSYKGVMSDSDLVNNTWGFGGSLICVEDCGLAFSGCAFAFNQYSSLVYASNSGDASFISCRFSSNSFDAQSDSAGFETHRIVELKCSEIAATTPPFSLAAKSRAEPSGEASFARKAASIALLLFSLVRSSRQ